MKSFYILPQTAFQPKKLRFVLASICLMLFALNVVNAQAPLTVVPDPICSNNCCTQSVCSCTAGVIASGGVAPYTYICLGAGGPVGTSACSTGLCPGTYTFIVRDAMGTTVSLQITVTGACCHLVCPNDTAFCFSVPDSAIHLFRPVFKSGSPGGTGPDQCYYDSLWNNAPLTYPVGTTVVTWHVRSVSGQLDSCTQNVTRYPPSAYVIKFGTSPPIVGGVINICNGQSITFVDSSTGTTGRLWNFGNGYYSSNAIHTEPASHYPPGTYYDTLTVYDDCGNPHDTAFTVVVDSASGPDIYCISVVCPGDTVTYHTYSTCTTYNWAVTGGVFYPTPATTSDSATVIWGNGPHGTISLSVSGCTPPSTCSVATIKTIDIVPPVMQVAGDTIICAGSVTTYCIECMPGNTHSWELMPANAGTVEGANTCCVTVHWAPNFFGVATLQVNYHNVLTGSGCNLPGTCSHDPGCGGIGLITVHVLPIFGIAGPSKVCPNTVSAPFNGMNLTSNTVEASTSWKLVTPVPSTLTFATTALLNAYTWNNGIGTYQLTAYAPPGIYCNDSAITTVEVVEIKIPNAITGPDTVCANVPVYYSVSPNMAGVTYTWNVSGGTPQPPLNGPTIAIIWNPGGGTVSVTQTLSASPGCVSPASPVFTVKTWPAFALPAITASGPIACVKATINYSIPLPLISNGTYTWSVVPATAGNILTANGTNQVSIQWISNAITPIYVKLKISRCYTDSVMLPVTLFSLPPVPSISFTPPDPCVFTPVNFTTTSAGPIYNWSFGDAGTSTLQNPTHPYGTAGDFPIQLYVTNAQGCSDTAFSKVHVDSLPAVPTIQGPVDVCIGANSQYFFLEPIYPGAAYTWSLSSPALGNVLGSGTNFLTVLWNTPGTDTVKLHLQSTCLDTTIRYVVNVHALPVPGVSFPSPACEGAIINFTGSGGVTYSWGFAGGTPGTSTLQNPSVTYPVAGNFGVYLSVIDAYGCTNSTNTTINVHPLPIAWITGPNNVCTLPATVSLTAVDQGGYTFVWSPSGTTATITPTVTTPTTFSVVVTNSFGCSKVSNSITISGGYCPNSPSTGCNITPNLDFTWSPPVCLSTTFTKTGTDTLVGWDFGDGGTAGAVSPISHTYPIPGLYLVKVYCKAYGLDAMGGVCVDTIEKSHIVTIPFDAQWDVSFQCSGGNVMKTNFINNSLFLGNATAYNWTWYDNTYATTIITGAFPGPVTLAAGLHSVSLIIFDPVTLATCTLTKNITVPVPISAAFTFSTPICQGAPNAFTDLSTPLGNEVSRLFNNGNGATSPFSPASLIYTNAPGPFNATLTVTDIYGCSSTSTQSVTVLPAGTGSITVGVGTCDSVQLTASGTGPYNWMVVSPPTTSNPIYVHQSGFYKVTAIGANGCPYTAGPVQVTVKRSPTATITGRTTYCQGENLDLKTTSAGVSFAWIRLPATPVGGNAPNLNVPATIPGPATYMVTITGSNGCTATATYSVFVDPVPSSAVIVASGPLTFCQGDSVKLMVSPPGSSYLWSKSPTPALSAPANTNANLWVTAAGTYSVIVQTASGCPYPAIAPVTITVNPLPDVRIGGDTILCEGETIQLQTLPVGGATYLWNGPNATGTNNPFVKANAQVTDSGIYTVTVTNIYGCSATDSILVIVHPSPPAPFIYSNPGGVLCEGQLYTLIASPPPVPPITYTWSTGQQGDSIRAARAGDYSVTATNQYGCTSSSNVITIHPLPDLSCVAAGCYEFCNECDSVTIPGPVGFASYDWQKLVGGIWTSYANTTNLTVFSPGGMYRLLASNLWGCADSTDTLKIDFKDCCPPPPPPSCLDTCTNFNDNAWNGFGPHPAGPNVIVSTNNAGSQGGPNDFYLQMQDQPGASFVTAGSQYNGKWCCGTFCFDYKLINDGGTGGNANPSFTIMNGTLGFKFTSAVTANQSNGWHTICAPITDCNPPPVSPSGVWSPIAGTALIDWTNVLSNVTDLIFKVDYTTAPDEISAIDNICIHSSVPNIHTDPDTAICAGTILTLHVYGCTGTPEWHVLSGDSVIFLTNGPIIDVAPTQNTCYMVTCCGAAGCCCDTDTICITVNQPPVINWQTSFGTVCLNSDSILLDTANIFVFINNTWVPVSTAGGTIVFSGTNVIGNYFYPNTLGTSIITVTYTDSAGCSSTVSLPITVISCCVNTCHADAGPDQTVCLGHPAILSTTGCDSLAIWYTESPDGGLVVVGTGQTVDVIPQQTTCYYLICCGGGNCCCDTDTVCIFVKPLPILQWPQTFANVCLNSDSILLDTANIFVYINNTWVPVANAGGSGVFVGVGVVGNYFHPTSLGPHLISYVYTDTSGCSATVSVTINVIPCCINTCVADAGPDQTICQGEVAILTATGCDSSSTWYTEVEGNWIQVAIGQQIDVIPQQSTCYYLICCGSGGCCCDTDTVCITVNPHPILQWMGTYQTVCQNGAPVFLSDTSINVYIGNTWVPVSMAGGTGVFSGPGVVGNVFTPPGLGTFTITYTYTDPNGCIASIYNYITVINCCTNTCVANAGPDQTICQGEAAILTTTGCDSSATWYTEVEGNWIQVAIGQQIDVIPQQSTCYYLICCGGGGCCCDTDTVCITVNPHPILQWMGTYQTVCQNGAPVLLSDTSINVYIGNTWVPVSMAGGTGVFSGPGVVGNVFTPPGLGTFTITYTYTDPNGCSAAIYNYITVINCCTNTCVANAGPDQTICQGEAAILTTTGCDSSATWYTQVEGNWIQVAIGQQIDVMPQQSTCYYLICCGGGGCCCDTDTVCITVNPHPILQWPYTFQDVCSNNGPVFLDASLIMVYVGNTWVPVTTTGGTGFFSGPGVVGNTFIPPGLGSYVITYTYTDPNGCTASIYNFITVISCGCDPITCNCNAIPPPPPPTITIVSVTADSCNNSGCIHASFTGCCLLYSYTYYDPCNPDLSYSVAQTQDNSIFCNLAAGTYVIYAQDACGNIAQQTVVVPSVNGPLTAWVNYSMCATSICVAVEGGCPPYSYNWTGGATTACVSTENPCTDRVVTITDSRGCSVTLFVTVPHFDFTDVVQPGCCSSNGSICVNGCFGQMPYTYQWSNGATTACISGLASGTYCVTVTNGNGQSFTCCYTLTDLPPSPPSVSFNFGNCGTNVTAVITNSGCGQYTYHWENNSTELFRSEVHACDSLTFTIVMCDGSVHHYGTKVPQVLASISPVNCQTGYGMICASVACFRCEPYTYSWSPAEPWQDNSSSCFGAPAGQYTLCITNACGDVVCCNFILPHTLSASISFTTIGACPGMSNGAVQSIVTGGMPPYSYSWSNGATTQNLSGVPAGFYTLTVTDANGCITTSSPVIVGNRICSKWMDIRVWIDGFYHDLGSTSPMDNYGTGGCLYLSGISSSPSDVDTVKVSLVDPLTFVTVDSSAGILQTDGHLTVIFASTTLDGNSYYVKLNHRNSLETWSSVPVSMTDPVTYDFTDAINKAYGNNLRDLGNGQFAIWSGDVNQNGSVESSDFSQVESSSQLFLYGYLVTDVTGDNIVESADYSLIENNVQLLLILSRP